MDPLLRSYAVSLLSERANEEASSFKLNGKPIEGEMTKYFMLDIFLGLVVDSAVELFPDNKFAQDMGAEAELRRQRSIAHERYVRGMEGSIKDIIMAANGRQLWELIRLLATRGLLDVYRISGVWVMRPKGFVAALFDWQRAAGSGENLRKLMNWQR